MTCRSGRPPYRSYQRPLPWFVVTALPPLPHRSSDSFFRSDLPLHLIRRSSLPPSRRYRRPAVTAFPPSSGRCLTAEWCRRTLAPAENGAASPLVGCRVRMGATNNDTTTGIDFRWRKPHAVRQEPDRGHGPRLRDERKCAGAGLSGLSDDGRPVRAGG